MTNYETTLVVTPNMTEVEAQNVVGKISTLIAKSEGRIYAQGFWGKQRLAYPIGQHEYGYYATLVFTYPAEQTNTLDRELQLMPEVMRYLIISLDKEKIRPEDIKLIDPFKEQFAPTRSTTARQTTPRRTPAQPVAPKKDEATRLKELEEKLGDLLKEE